ncbi:protein of unknown function [Xenorhabdus doucetiae]|uniref:Uncharacterized protein n=1 Tax=Xenorhabdus doucetiae TaxID=351671 RepID=A0A068QT20_9GAMM|nr:protein of unknown function [Xenorhabdus doucetiae]
MFIYLSTSKSVFSVFKVTPFSTDMQSALKYVANADLITLLERVTTK